MYEINQSHMFEKKKNLYFKLYKSNAVPHRMVLNVV